MGQIAESLFTQNYFASDFLINGLAPLQLFGDCSDTTGEVVTGSHRTRHPFLKLLFQLLDESLQIFSPLFIDSISL